MELSERVRGASFDATAHPAAATMPACVFCVFMTSTTTGRPGDRGESALEFVARSENHRPTWRIAASPMTLSDGFR